MLKEFLLTSAQKQVLGVALTPGVGLEAAIYDKSKNNVLKYGRRKVEYNFSTREVQDYVELKTALSELVKELAIAPNTMAYMVLPNVFFDFMEVPPNITEEEIKTALLSKAEEFYLFKKEEPVSGWCDVVNINNLQKRLAYSSFQKSAVENLKEIFKDVGLKLVGIESSYSATIRGLYSIGLLNDIIEKNESWTAMLVNTNSYTLLNFDGENFLESRDVPIAIKSFSTEEAYAAIASSASQLLDNFSAKKLFIISQTDDISAEVLKYQIQSDSDVTTIESNQYAYGKESIVPIMQASDFNIASAMTLGVIGASSLKTDLGLIINVLSNDQSLYLGVYYTTTFKGLTVDITSELIMKLSVLAALACVIVFGSIALIFYLVSTNTENKIGEITSEIRNIDNILQSETQNEPNREIDMNQIIDDIAAMNVKTMKFYDSISDDIPKNIWLTRYYNQFGDKVVITGIAESIVDIYEYYKNLKIVSPESDIKLTELKVVTNDENNPYLKGLAINTDKNRLYSFEISNTAINYNSYQSGSGDSAGQNNNQKPVNEGDIIIKPTQSPNANVEQMSNQAKPVQ